MPDIFICHASEDKKEIARPIAVGLRNRGIDVWYDEFSLKVGDSLTLKIDEGLSQAKFGVVILSKNFFGKSWPERELRGLSSRELNGNETVILPIWHKISQTDILEYYPPLADKLAIESSKDIEIILDKIVSILGAKKDVFLKIPKCDISISPFPVTNYEYKRFVEASGYESEGQERWWSTLGKEVWENYIARKKHDYLWDEVRREDIPFEHPMYWENTRFNNYKQPVVGVSWFEAEAYCNWLSEYLTQNNDKKITIRMPNENEWIFAATGEREILFPWGNSKPSSQIANIGNKKGAPSTYGSYPEGSSWVGCHDMVGNVWEWLNNFNDFIISDEDPDKYSITKIIGGCVYDMPEKFKSIPIANRRPGYRHAVIGFRTVSEIMLE